MTGMVEQEDGGRLEQDVRGGDGEEDEGRGWSRWRGERRR